MVSIVGLPMAINGKSFNCAAAIQNGRILGIVPKTNLPNYNEFYEARWFISSDLLDVDEIEIDEYSVPIGADLIFAARNYEKLVFGIEICEDLEACCPQQFSCTGGASLLFNLSAGNELACKAEFRRDLVKANPPAAWQGMFIHPPTQENQPLIWFFRASYDS